MSVQIVLETPPDVAGALAYSTNGEFKNGFIQGIPLEPFTAVSLVSVSIPLATRFAVVAGVNDAFAVSTAFTPASAPPPPADPIPPTYTAATTATVTAGTYTAEGLAAAVTTALQTAFPGGIGVTIGGNTVYYTALTLQYDGEARRFYFADERKESAASPVAFRPGILEPEIVWQNVHIVFSDAVGLAFAQLIGFDGSAVTLPSGAPVYASFTARGPRFVYAEIPELNLVTYVGSREGTPRSIVGAIPIEENDSEGLLVFVPPRPARLRTANADALTVTALTVRLLVLDASGRLAPLGASDFDPDSPVTVVILLEPGSAEEDEAARSFDGRPTRLGATQKARFVQRAGAAVVLGRF